jgi:hypothetical protein
METVRAGEVPPPTMKELSADGPGKDWRRAGMVRPAPHKKHRYSEGLAMHQGQ